MADETKLVVVLGMHRSGTSLMTSGLSSLGVDFGGELMGASPSNPKGHWEDNDIVSLNNRVLNNSSMKWDSLESLQHVRWQDNQDPLLLEGVQLIKSKLKHSEKVFGFKDPRTIRVLPFWFKVFELVEVVPKIVFAFRNPVDVCKSLQKRDGKSIYESQLLWLIHNLDNLLVLDRANYKTIFVDFYDFCKNTKGELKRLSKFLGLQTSEAAIHDFYSSFYDENLVSQKSTPFQISHAEYYLTVAKSAYSLLRLRAEEDCSTQPDLLTKVVTDWRCGRELLIEQYLLLKERPDIISSSHTVNNIQLNKHLSEFHKKLDKMGENLESNLSNKLDTQVGQILSGVDNSKNTTVALASGEIEKILFAVKRSNLEKYTKIERGLKEITLGLEAKFRNELLSLKNRNRNLYQRQNRLEIQKQAILNSWSWKITAPLRFLAQIFSRS